ncbi:hypothetical protein KIPB_016595, partial [Kipferlia bialata]
YVPLGNTIVADVTPMRQRTKAIAYVGGASAAGGFIAPFVNIWLTEAGYGWKPV